MIYLGIVGSEGKFWTPRQRTQVVKKILEIFNSHALRYGDGNAPEYNYDGITFVSGGCGGATSDHDKIKFNGGIDEWAEIVADLLGIKKSIDYPEINQFRDAHSEDETTVLEHHGMVLKGYQSRNDNIAEDITILYCIDPANRNWSGGRYTLEKARQLGKEVHLVFID